MSISLALLRMLRFSFLCIVNMESPLSLSLSDDIILYPFFFFFCRDGSGIVSIRTLLLLSSLHYLVKGIKVSDLGSTDHSCFFVDGYRTMSIETSIQNNSSFFSRRTTIQGKRCKIVLQVDQILITDRRKKIIKYQKVDLTHKTLLVHLMKRTKRKDNKAIIIKRRELTTTII